MVVVATKANMANILHLLLLHLMIVSDDQFA
jgi:hypothetical protein